MLEVVGSSGSAEVSSELLKDFDIFDVDGPMG